MDGVDPNHEHLFRSSETRRYLKTGLGQQQGQWELPAFKLLGCRQSPVRFVVGTRLAWQTADLLLMPPWRLFRAYHVM